MSGVTEKTQASPGRKLPWRWILGIAAVLIFGGGLFYYVQPFATKAIIVTVETVKGGPVTRVLAVNGRIAAMHSVDVRSQVSGTLAALPIVEGGSVRVGDVLARINPTSQDAIVRQSRASLEAGRVAEALANANYKRLAALKGVVTRSAIETAASNARSASEDVRRLAALFDQAEIQLAKFTVLAPISGTVLSIESETGQLIDPAMALVTLADLGQLIVETDVDEVYSTQIKEQMPAVLKLVGENTTRTGKVNLVARKVNAATGGLAIEIAFDGPVSAPVGLTVTMNIIVDKQDSALSVPRAAIVSEAAGSSVFILENSIARKRGISVVEWPADRLIVTKGLELGDMVIMDATGMSDGLKVKTALATAALATPQPAAAP
jgi:RND family efflux transporter MFP subunit